MERSTKYTMKKTYDRLAAGERLRNKRTKLGFTQDEVAEKIDRATKYYADIERGNCGMSVETMMALSETLDMPLDYIINGTSYSELEAKKNSDEIVALLELLDKTPKSKKKYFLELIRLFLVAIDNKKED